MKFGTVEKIQPQVNLSDRDVDNLVKKYKYRPADKYMIESVYKTIENVIKPIVYYKVLDDMNGYEYFHSQDNKNKRLAIVAVTMGQYIDRLQDIFSDASDLFTASIIDNLSLEIMMKVYSVMAGDISKKYGLWLEKYIFVGDGMQIEHMNTIMDELKPKEIECNAAYNLIPAKSVVFAAQLSDKVHGDVNLCGNCSNKRCQFRTT